MKKISFNKYDLIINDNSDEIIIEFDEKLYKKKDILEEVDLISIYIEREFKNFIKEYDNLKTFDDIFNFAIKYKNISEIKEPSMYAKFISLKKNKNTSWMVENKNLRKKNQIKFI